MKRPEYLLSVTAAASCDVVTIHGDRTGLVVLRDRINELLAKLDREECDHEHFANARVGWLRTQHFDARRRENLRP
jgi:hypothetical protein